MIIKCKMCGGDMVVSPDQKTGTCEYCGSTMTLPKVDDEQRAAAFNRGNYFRRIGEFDKALAVYEGIVREDDTDAEAHWCCALCRFGIEYVKDPASGEYLPTCHRASFDSFLEDVDYKAALAHADVVARAQYQKDAEKIAQVQRGILSISQKEQPFDVFICYKETDENGQRTVDSTLAQDIYYQLTEQGRRVFFARITLEDKAGQEYEPYIFAALHSAKVMVVVGTKPEYFNAVWVKNEWSRYLALMKHDRKRLLIPCYRDMDPYDLPEQLSVLQSYDMSKIGFIQDLIRGIAKVLDADKKPEEKVVERVIEHDAGGAAPGIDSLMKRAYLFMEDGDFDSADEYLNRVLDIDPNYAPAYAARTCTALRFRRESELGEATFWYNSNPDWKKALRFADEKQKKTYTEYQEKTDKRVWGQIRDYTYDCAMEIAVNPNVEGNPAAEAQAYLQSCQQTEPGKRADGQRRAGYQENEQKFLKAVSENDPGSIAEAQYKVAAQLFEVNANEPHINDQKSAERAKQCLALAEQVRQKKIYLDASEVYKKANTDRDVKGLLKAAEAFETVPAFRNASKLAEECRQNAARIQTEDYQAVLDAMKTAGKESRAWKKVCEQLSTPNLDGYRDTAQLLAKAEEEYETCFAEEERIRKEKEAREARARHQKLKKVAAVAAVAVVVAVVVAIAAFVVNDKVIQPSVQYKEAKALMEEQRYWEAYVVYSRIRGYKDSDQILTTNENLKKTWESLTVGSEIRFGQYEQDGNTGNGKEAIEWLVLAEEDEKYLLLSKYGLDAKPYHSQGGDITWEKSTVREWLNQDFMDGAFTEGEQDLILETKVDNSDAEGYYGYDTSGGSNTEDSVFLLSYKEAFEEYFTSDEARVCMPTSYAVQQGAWTYDETGACWWWLRSPGGNQPSAARVNYDGSRGGSSVYSDSRCVRPALWINPDF